LKVADNSKVQQNKKMELDKTPAFDISANDSSLTKSKKKKKKDKQLDIGEKQAESTFQVEPSEKPAQVSLIQSI
jgi:hypothetical protein